MPLTRWSIIVLALAAASAATARPRLVVSDAVVLAGSAAAAKPSDKPAAPEKRKPPGWKVSEHRGLAYVDMIDVAAFFGLAPPRRDGSKVLLSRESPPLEWRAQTGSKLVSLNKLRLYLSYPVVAGKNGRTLLSAFDLVHVIDPILRPEHRDPTRLQAIVLDPARGGAESGIVTGLGTEKEITLDIAKRLKTLLEAAGYTVLVTREVDIDLAVDERVLLANSMREESIFLSLHCSHGSDHERGVETFTLAPSGTPSTTGDEGRAADQKFYPGNINDRESMALATALQGKLLTELKATDLGIRRARFDELKGVAMPAVVCSVGRLAHPEEGKRLGGDPGYRQRVAAALGSGIERYARVMAAGNQPRDRLLKFGQVQVFPDKVRSLTGEQVRVRASVVKTEASATIDAAKVVLQVFFLDFVNNEEIDLSTCDTPQADWISVTPNWQQANYEQVEFTYQQPMFDESLLKSLGRRTYYGFVLRLVYDGVLMDEFAEPANLKRGLGNFTAILPRRG